MEQKELIETLREYFNTLDTMHKSVDEGYKEGTVTRHLEAERKLRNEILTDNDRKAISMLSEYRSFANYLKAEEDLFPLCDTTTARKIIRDFTINMYHREEARNGDL